MQALVNGRVLTDSGIREHQTVVINHGRIESVINDCDMGNDIANRRNLGGNYLLPGFIDVQVNGGGGALFNDTPSIEAIQHIGATHRKYGTTGFLPTLISDHLPVVKDAITAVESAIRAEVPGVLGIHLEGPFLNPAKKGVHDDAKFRVLDDAAIQLLSSLEGGVTVLTIAPETTTSDMVAKLVEEGAIVCAGHTNATYEEIQLALAAGVSGFTHLFNAMSPLDSRRPGVVGAALEDNESWCGLIVDGHHVHPATMRVAIASKRIDRFMLVTDAMPCVGTHETQFLIDGRTIHVIDGKCVTDSGVLAGSNLDMTSAVRNAVSMLNVDLADAARMASQYPAEFLGLGAELGRISDGYRANFVLIDDEFNVLDTWIDGCTGY